MAAGFIERAGFENPYASCPVVAAKRGPDGNWTDHRFCVDMRKVNDMSEGHPTRPPLPENIFDRMHGKRVFSSLDVRAGFHNIPLDPESRKLTAFCWDNQLWQYTRLCFGLKTAIALFQERIEETIRRHGLGDFAFAFVDDVVIASESLEQHGEHVKRVLQARQADGWSVHPGKSIFGARTVQYLGHLITPDGTEPLEAKTAAIKALPAPKDVKEVRSILGLLNFYRCYLPRFSIIAAPLNELLKKCKAFI